jgi:hypothetical protein
MADFLVKARPASSAHCSERGQARNHPARTYRETGPEAGAPLLDDIRKDRWDRRNAIPPLCRAALVLDKQRGADCSWKKSMRYYNMRNQIAHGTLLASSIDVIAVNQDFFLIQGELEA